jgi:hypothetical protein
MGGLGNQIFQIFATISYCIKSRNEFKFLNLKILGDGFTTSRNTYWESFFHNLKHFLIDKLPSSIHVIKENGFEFNEMPAYSRLNKDVMFCGYYQSYKYFHQNYDLICRMIGLKQSKIDLLQKLNYNIDNDITNNQLKDTISIHFRIGDYKKNQTIHPIMTKEYYFRSLQHIKSKDVNKKYTIMYFCEDVDINDVLVTINYLKDNLLDFEFVRGENSLADWEQMLLMSCCHHNVIANSSFSWWSGYFNSWEDKIVCYPSVWFGERANNNTMDLCPPEWSKITA